MARYRKKPVVIEAVQYAWNEPDTFMEEVQDDIADFVGENVSIIGSDIVIETLEGSMTASPGDWIIKGVAGEFYPCKPDIFEATYERVDA